MKKKIKDLKPGDTFIKEHRKPVGIFPPKIKHYRRELEVVRTWHKDGDRVALAAIEKGSEKLELVGFDSEEVEVDVAEE